MRRVLPLCFLIIPICFAYGQEQERKLIDRIMKPDMSLQNDAQNKKFTADKTSVNKKARVNTFYLQQSPRAKPFSGTREFSSKQFKTANFNNGSPGMANNLAAKNAATSTYLEASKSSSVHPAYDQNKQQGSHDYPGNRPFLEKGKSQKFLNRKNRPMTIEEVRELLNKNK